MFASVRIAVMNIPQLSMGKVCVLEFKLNLRSEISTGVAQINWQIIGNW